MKRLARLSILALALCPAVFGTIAPVANTSCGAATTCTTGAINTTGATLAVIAATDFNNTIQAANISDSKGNTWTNLTTQFSSTTRARLFYSVLSSVGSGHTFTVASASFPSIVVRTFSGVKTSSPFDVETGGTSSTTTVATGSLTPSENNELIVTGVGFDRIATPSIDSGFNTPVGVNFSSGSNMGTSLSYIIQTTATAVNPTWTVSGSGFLAAPIASFKAAAPTNCASCDLSDAKKPPGLGPQHQTEAE